MSAQINRRLAAIAALLAGALSLPAAAAQFQAGAAMRDTTPPPFDAAADAANFPLCPAAVFTGPRAFLFEEPYVDGNNNGIFDYVGDVYCEANANTRWDGIFISGGVDHQAQTVHDAIDARAVAISDGTHAVVIESVVAQGLFINLIDRIRARAFELQPGISDVIVSATHNESSPDTVGIYGAPNAADTFGLRSGRDPYYEDYLVEQSAQAAAAAYADLRPAILAAKQAPLPGNVAIDLSNNFPTTDDDDQPAAVDFNLRVLQAKDATTGANIFTLMNLAAHNQEIGHSSHYVDQMSSDWPGYFNRAIDTSTPSLGLGVFLVSHNGSQEDAQTVPPLTADDDPECDSGCYAQAQATGEAYAAAVKALLPSLVALRPGPVSVQRAEFFVPIENNLFLVASKAGLFGDRPTYIAGVDVGVLGNELKTAVSVADLGPDLQLLTAPGEAFPALMIGSPWGIEDAGCPTRDNPSPPVWHAHARFRFVAGLAQDFIGYMIPAWGFSSEKGTFLSNCSNDSDNRDPAGHKHKLEDEGVGPIASNAVATQLAALLDREPDPLAVIRPGRYVHADGSVDRKAAGAVAVWVADADATELKPGKGLLVALSSVGGFGAQKVTQHGVFMDFSGQPSAMDLNTRGMLQADSAGNVTHRYYLDLYPALAVTPLDAAVPPGDDGRDGGARHHGGGGAMPAPALLLLALAARRRRAGGYSDWAGKTRGAY